MIMDRIESFTSSTAFTALFKSLGLSVSDVSISKMMVQSSSEPYTCYDGIKDGKESDVDCGGTDCEARCAASQMCSVKEDCADGSCNSGKCSGVDWTRIFYIACIVVAVIVIIIIISVVVGIIKKKVNLLLVVDCRAKLSVLFNPVQSEVSTDLHISSIIMVIFVIVLFFE